MKKYLSVIMGIILTACLVACVPATHIPTTNISNNQYMIPAINAFGILVLICAAECPAAIVHPIKVCMNDAASWKNDLQSERNTSDCTA